MSDEVYTQFIPSVDPRLGRHIRHDPASRGFPTRKGVIPTADIRHRRHGLKLDQGNVGACTGFAAAHVLNTDPVRKNYRYVPTGPLLKRYRTTLREKQALQIYSIATSLDPWQGSYPPDDTGSSGLAACKAMQQLGHCTSYQWGFGFQHGLRSIADAPYMQGTYWKWSMMIPDANGLVSIKDGDAGGHEYEWIGVEITSKINLGKNLSWFFNSWGPSYGEGGYFAMTWDDHEALLAQDGDLIRPIV